MISLSIGIGLTRTIGQAGPTNPITGTGPTLAALTDGDTLSSAVTWGSYLPGGATADRQMRVDGGAWVAYVGGTVVAEAEVWQVREVVSYSGFTSTFASAAQAVAEAAAPGVPVIVLPGSIDAQPLVGQPILVTDPTVSGATSTAYQWYDGDPAGSGTPISGWTSAAPTPTATQYALAAPIWRRATYTNASGSVTEALEAPGVVGFVWQDDFASLAVGDNTTAILAAGYTRWSSNATTLYWAGSVVANADAPAGRGISFNTANAANHAASPNAPVTFLAANGFGYYEELIMFVHDGTGGRFAFRGRGSVGVDYPPMTAGLSIRLNAAQHQLPGEDPNNTAGTGMGTLTANAVYFVRHRIQGNESRLKIWLASAAEPDWSLANVRTHTSALAAYGPGMGARVTGYSKTCLYMSCGANTPAPFWSGYAPPAEVITDPMAYSASASATSASMFNNSITFNLEDI